MVCPARILLHTRFMSRSFRRRSTRAPRIRKVNDEKGRETSRLRAVFSSASRGDTIRPPMTKCPSCSQVIPEDRQSCPSCGTALEDSFTPTRLFVDTPRAAQTGKEPSAPRAGTRPVSRPARSSDSIDNARFVPGTILAERYRMSRLNIHGYVPLEKSPEVLRDRARAIIGRLGCALALYGFYTSLAGQRLFRGGFLQD